MWETLSLPKDITTRDRVVAGVYEDFLSVVLDEPAVIAITTFGLSDQYTWLTQNHPRKDGLPVRPPSINLSKFVPRQTQPFRLHHP